LLFKYAIDQPIYLSVCQSVSKRTVDTDCRKRRETRRVVETSCGDFTVRLKRNAHADGRTRPIALPVRHSPVNIGVILGGGYEGYSYSSPNFQSGVPYRPLLSATKVAICSHLVIAKFHYTVRPHPTRQSPRTLSETRICGPGLAKKSARVRSGPCSGI